MESIGVELRRERELRQVSLEELSQTTRIPLKMLRHLEAGRYAELPGEVFARGFLRSYARAVGLDAQALVARYDAGRMPVDPPPAPIPALAPPERSRRLGMAIALVILLILFTLALSVVLRPRHRDAGFELSSTSQEWPLPPASAEPSSFAASTTAKPTASSRS